MDFDILGYIKDGLKYAADKGAIKRYAPDLFRVVNMNLGWEIPGRNIVTA